MSSSISEEFPFDSKFAEVLGSKMHFIEEGEGDPVLFLHGNPTSSYLWRNIIPHLTPHARCIAPDLIGMGKSDKPDIGYRFADHSRYIEEFIRNLGLTNVTLVVHDWGSALGFHYAMRHAENIKGIAFMEAMVKPPSWRGKPFGVQVGIRLFRLPVFGYLMVNVLNLFIRQMLPSLIVRKLTDAEKAFYAAPFPTAASRVPLRRWPCEVPLNRKPANMHKLMTDYCERLQQSDIPKLLLYATPGAAIDSEQVAWCEENLPNLKTVGVGEGLHYIQEDNPEQIGKELSEWYQAI